MDYVTFNVITCSTVMCNTSGLDVYYIDELDRKINGEIVGIDVKKFLMNYVQTTISCSVPIRKKVTLAVHNCLSCLRTESINQLSDVTEVYLYDKCSICSSEIVDDELVDKLVNVYDLTLYSSSVTSSLIDLVCRVKYLHIHNERIIPYLSGKKLRKVYLHIHFEDLHQLICDKLTLVNTSGKVGCFQVKQGSKVWNNVRNPNCDVVTINNKKLNNQVYDEIVRIKLPLNFKSNQLSDVRIFPNVREVVARLFSFDDDLIEMSKVLPCVDTLVSHGKCPILTKSHNNISRAVIISPINYSSVPYTLKCSLNLPLNYIEFKRVKYNKEYQSVNLVIETKSSAKSGRF